MVTPAKGDYQGVQLTPEARKVADAWDPAKDEAAGEQCKSYGAPALMSVPGRLHITWQDDNTLKVETDAGTQTRLLRFGDEATRRHGRDTPRTWQGVSQAQWLMPRPNVPLQLRPADRTADAPPLRPTGGSLQVVTTNLRAGYLRKNGVPYSENAVLTEHWDLYKRPNGEEWLTITTQVEDPQYLRNVRLTAPVFKKEPERQQVGSDAVLGEVVEESRNAQRAKLKAQSRTVCRVDRRGHAVRGSRVRPGRSHRHVAARRSERQRRRAGTGRSPGHAAQR